VARLGEIRKGLKDRLSTITGLEAYATMPASPRTPSAAVIPRSRELRTFDGAWLYRFSVWVYVNSSDLNQAQQLIDNFLSVDDSKSIELAIERDQSLGGIADYAVVTGWGDYAQLVDIAGGQLLGARIDVEVLAS
jgi:hypothetical protein